MQTRLPEIYVATSIAVSAALIALVSYLPKTFFEPYLLSSILGTVFIGLGYTLVAYVSARSYLKTSSRIFVMLGMALLMSAAGAMGFWVTTDANFRTTIGSITALFSGMLQIGAAIMAYRNLNPRQPSGHRMLKLLTGYGGVVITVVIVGIATTIALIPPFFIQGTGGTLVRQGVVAAAIFLISTASILMLRLYGSQHENILRWYGLALALLALGVTDGFFAVTLGGVLSWVGRISVYMSGVYFILLVLRGTGAQQSTTDHTPGLNP